MSVPWWRLGAVAALLLTLGPPAWAGPAPAADFEARLRGMEARGEMSEGRAELYRLYAVRAPERLPAELRMETASGRGLRALSSGPEAEPWVVRCGTPILRRVRAALGRMPPELRAEAADLLDDRPPAGRAAFRTAAGKTGTAVLANRLVTDNFSIEWGPDLTNEDGTTPPADDGPVDADDPAVGGNGIPDVVERWAAYFEAAFRVEVGDMGYTHPVVEGNLIPVYIGNSDPSTPIENIGSGTYAFTQPDGVPYIVVNNDLSFVPPNGEGASAPAKIHGAMKITAAHELFHVFHFLYEPQAWIPNEDDWWFECSSTWMEDEVFDAVNDYYQYFQQSGGRPGWTYYLENGLPVRSNDLSYVTRAYGSVIFAKYLSEHVGGRPALFDVWQRIRLDGLRILPALDAFATSNGFQGLPDLFLGFVGATAVMDYEEGENYGSVQWADGLASQSSLSAGLPAYLGAVYSGGTAGEDATLTLSGVPDAAAWGLAVVKLPFGGSPLLLGSIGSGGTSVPLAVGEPNVSIWAGVAYLDPDLSAQGWTLVSSSSPSGDTVAPGAASNLRVTETSGGFDLAWDAPQDPDVAGYVVSWGTGNRTLYGPVTTVAVRELPVGDYTVSVAAYDGTGNLGPETNAPVSVTEATAPTATPAARVVSFVENDPPPGPTVSGGGGGGGGCFLELLGL
ncbi:fibronectin type III domain-containing protein [Deferrisoma camini]|uniref:fibronectin type III domain-containing protein n=1 Tax=Deferrisoma camini TaxID=1035120 RepID=UPI00046CDBAB|nr:fibronectin type III domain-containing protein [Deferrisoma camini]